MFCTIETFEMNKSFYQSHSHIYFLAAAPPPKRACLGGNELLYLPAPPVREVPAEPPVGRRAVREVEVEEEDEAPNRDRDAVVGREVVPRGRDATTRPLVVVAPASGSLPSAPADAETPPDALSLLPSDADVTAPARGRRTPLPEPRGLEGLPRAPPVELVAATSRTKAGDILVSESPSS